MGIDQRSPLSVPGRLWFVFVFGAGGRSGLAILLVRPAVISLATWLLVVSVGLLGGKGKLSAARDLMALVTGNLSCGGAGYPG